MTLDELITKLQNMKKLCLGSTNVEVRNGKGGRTTPRDVYLISWSGGKTERIRIE